MRSAGGGGRLTAKCLYEELSFPSGSGALGTRESGGWVVVFGLGIDRWSMKGFLPLLPLANCEQIKCADLHLKGVNGF